MSKSSKKTTPPLSASNKPQKHSVVVGRHYQGPVPPPEIMEQMNKILPDAAERIFTMAENEQNSVIADRKQTQDREDKIVENRHIENMTGLFMAFGVCLSFCVGGVILVLNGYEIIGSVLLGTTMTAVVGSFLMQKKNK